MPKHLLADSAFPYQRLPWRLIVQDVLQLNVGAQWRALALLLLRNLPLPDE